MQTKRNIGKTLWVDLLSPTTEEVRSVMEEYGIDPRATQDLIIPTIRPFIEQYGEFIYFVLHFPSQDSNKNEVRHEIDFIIGKNFILTTRYENIDALHKFERMADVNSMIEKDTTIEDTGSLLSGMMLTIYQSLDDELESVKDELNYIDERIFKGEEKEMVKKLSLVSRQLLSFKHALDPHSDIFVKLSEHGEPLFGKNFELHMRHIHSGLAKIHELARRYTESLNELRRTNDSLLEARQSEIMKIFTGITVISSVLTIISSWFLIESPKKPFVDSDHEFWYVGLLMLVVALILGFFMKKKKWL